MPLGTAKAALLGAGAGGNANYFGDGSDGALTTSGNVTYARNATTQDMILKQYTSINIGSGDTVTVDGHCRGLFLYCEGDCTITGTLAMSATGTSYNTGKGSTHDPSSSTASSDGASVSSTGLRIPMVTSGGSDTLAAADFAGCGNAVVNAVANQDAISSNGTIFKIARNGGAGGGGSGAGSNGATGAATISAGGGGGGGRGALDSCGVGGTGGVGTCFGGGGSGGGSQGGSCCTGGHALFNRGNAGCQGGTGWGGHTVGNGADGGGTIILIVGGDLTITGTISAKGGAATAGNAYYCAGGGGSGGGNILILYAGTLSNSGTVTATKGATGGPRTGGAGGTGGVHTEQVEL